MTTATTATRYCIAPEKTIDSLLSGGFSYIQLGIYLYLLCVSGEASVEQLADYSPIETTGEIKYALEEMISGGVIEEVKDET